MRPRASPSPIPCRARSRPGRRASYSVPFLRAIDWALVRHPVDRPQNVGELRSALFASHAGALGLQEALRRGPRQGARTKAGTGRYARARAFKARDRARLGRAAPARLSWPIIVKMTLAMVATALVPMLITAYYNVSSSQAYVADLELRNLEQLAQSTAGRISQLVSAMRGLADYAATDVFFFAYLAHPTAKGARDVQAKLASLAQGNPDIQFAMVIDGAGKALVTTDHNTAGQSFAHRDYIREAMEGRGHMTGIIVGSVAGASGVFFSRPVFSPDGQQVNGVVVMRVKADPIVRILGSTTDGKERQPFLVDADGVIVWHSDEKMMFKSLAPLPKPALDQIVADQRFHRDTIVSVNQPELAAAMVGGKGTGHVMYRSTSAGRDEIAGWAAVPGIEWVVGVTESSDYFAAPLQRPASKKALIERALLVGADVRDMAGMFFARSIVRPVERLKEAAEALKSGDYDNANIEVRSNDEVGQLARTFNVMIDVLRQRERERRGRSGRSA